eukprot:scaffold19754_cov137-Isochrysis_galbana.AAC.10
MADSIRRYWPKLESDPTAFMRFSCSLVSFSITGAGWRSGVEAENTDPVTNWRPGCNCNACTCSTARRATQRKRRADDIDLGCAVRRGDPQALLWEACRLEVSPPQSTVSPSLHLHHLNN